MAFSGVLITAGTASAINIGSVIHDKRDPYPAAIAGGILLVTLAFVDNWRSDLALALAACFLVGTLLLRGEAFFTWLADLVSAK